MYRISVLLYSFTAFTSYILVIIPDIISSSGARVGPISPLVAYPRLKMSKNEQKMHFAKIIQVSMNQNTDFHL